MFTTNGGVGLRHFVKTEGNNKLLKIGLVVDGPRLELFLL